MSKYRIGVRGAFFLYLLHTALATPLWNPQGIGRNIRHLPCVSRKTGEAGTCMFAFSCAKANGTHLGTCIDRFYFGSCCKIPDGELDVAPAVEDNHLGEGEGTTTPRIRPAITQTPPHSSTSRPHSSAKPSTTTNRPSSTLKPVTTNRPSTSNRPSSTNRPSTTNRPSSTNRPSASSTSRPSTTKRPSTSNRPSTTSKPSTNYKPSSTNRPSSTPKPPGSTKPPIVSSSRPQPSSSRPITDGHRPDLTTPSPTLVTWTTLEESSSHKPFKPQVSTPSAATHKPTIITHETFSPPKKPSTTLRPSTTHKPITSKPTVTKPTKPTKPASVKPGTSTARPAQPTTKPPSTTWIPVSVTTHAPSPQTTKKPVPTKKPVTAQTQKPSTASQNVVNVFEVSSTGKPQGSVGSTSKPGLITTVSHKPSISTTSKPITTEGSGRPQVVSSTTQRPSDKPTDHRPSSTHRPSTTPPHTSSTQTLTNESPGVVVIGSSTALPSIQTTQSQPTSTSTSTSQTSPTTPLPDTNEVESFNKTNYKEVCGRRLFPEARIVGGQLSGFGKWPWQISLRQWRTSTFLHKCGAALLNENWAITAAHCVENVPPSDLLLRLGEHDLSTEEEPYGYEERRVQIVASHPQFDPRTFEYDLALLRFYEPVKFQPNIIPVCVPEDDTNFVGSTAFVTGWGRLYEDGPLPSILQEVSVPVINNTLCETMYRAAGYIEHIPDIFICAGWKKGGFDSCEGDSGGPMVIQRPDRRWLLAGVISWGIGCAEPNQPGVYTRISQFRHWINQILQF